MKIAMCADLHLSGGEREWSLEVLKELVSKAESASPVLFIGGDLFDSLDDAEKLRKDYEAIIEASHLDQVIWAAGNHDSKNPSGHQALATLGQLSFGKKTMLVYDIRKGVDDKETNPIHVTRNSEFELIVIPYLEKPEWYSYASLPDKRAKRIILAHGTHADIAISEEAETSLFPRDFDRLYEADFMLLGHIHKHYKAANWLYPGSARVWRRGEDSEHGFIIYDTQTDAVTFVPLISGGSYKKISLFVESVLPKFSIPDMPYLYLDVELYGTVSDDTQANAIKHELAHILQPRCLKFTINDENLKTTALLAQNPVWDAFNHALESKRQSLEPELIDCARRLFMERILVKKK